MFQVWVVFVVVSMLVSGVGALSGLKSNWERRPLFRPLLAALVCFVGYALGLAFICQVQNGQGSSAQLGRAQHKSSTNDTHSQDFVLFSFDSVLRYVLGRQICQCLVSETRTQRAI